MILPGVTRDSLLSLARAHADPSNPFKLDGLPERLIVTEREITMEEIKHAASNGTLREFFGTGTAAVVTAVEAIRYGDEEIPVPVEGGKEAGLGQVASAFFYKLRAIQHGQELHEGWSTTV